MPPNGASDFFWGQARSYFKGIHSLEEAIPKFSQFLPEAEQAVNLLAEKYFPRLDPFTRVMMAHFSAYFAVFRPRLVQIWNADHLYAALAAAVAGVPLIVICAQSMSPRKRYPLGLESVDDQFARRAFDLLLGLPEVILTANSRAGRDDYRDWLGLDSERILLTPNIFVGDSQPPPGDEEVAAMRRNLGIPQEAKVIGGLFRLAAIKDPALWVNTAARVLRQRPDVYAVLGGDGPLFSQVAEAVAGGPFASRLLLPGRIEAVAAFHAMTDLHLLTSFVEGLPNTALEAQYAGKPVVSTLCGGIADIVADKESGLLVPEREAEALAACARFVLDHPTWAGEAGRKGRERVLRLFSKETAGKALLDMYTRLFRYVSQG